MTNRYRDEDVISPRPWRVENVARENDCACILDANGDPVVITDDGFYPPNLATAHFICKCVNERKE